MIQPTLLATACSILALATPTFGLDSLVEVAQESAPGVGDFDANVLGFVLPIESAQSVVDHYAYAGTTYNGTNPLPQSNTSLLFLHRDTIGGELSLVCVNGVAGGGTSRGDTRIDVLGDPNGVGWRVQDEPHGSGAPNDLYSPTALLVPSFSFTANQHWGQGGDGWALGDFEGEWELTLAFDSTIAGQQIQGLCCWKVISHDGFETMLSLQDQRRVRLRVARGSPFCTCDGTGSAPPCGNPGAAGNGCANSFFSEGAALSSFGIASVSADSLTLVSTRSTPGQPGLFFQGDTALNGGNGFLFGDGLRGAGDNVRRLQTINADGTGLTCSTVPIGAAGLVSPGETKLYQMWYRDPPPSPCGSGFNFTSGLELTWEP